MWSHYFTSWKSYHSIRVRISNFTSPGLADSVSDPVVTNGDVTSRSDDHRRKRAVTQPLYQQLIRCAVCDDCVSLIPACPVMFASNTQLSHLRPEVGRHGPVWSEQWCCCLSSTTSAKLMLAWRQLLFWCSSCRMLIADTRHMSSFGLWCLV